MTIYIPLDKLNKNLSNLNQSELTESFTEYVSLIEKSKVFETSVIERFAVYLEFCRENNILLYSRLEENGVAKVIEERLYETYNEKEIIAFIKKVIDIVYGRYNAKNTKKLIKIPKIKEVTPKIDMIHYLKQFDLFKDYTNRDLMIAIRGYKVISVKDTYKGEEIEKLLFVLNDENSSLPFFQDNNKYRVIINGEINKDFLQGERIKNLKARGKKTKGWQDIKETNFDFTNKSVAKNGMYHHIEYSDTTWWAFSNPVDKKLFVSSDSNLIIENELLDFVYKHIYFDFSFLKKFSMI